MGQVVRIKNLKAFRGVVGQGYFQGKDEEH